MAFKEGEEGDGDKAEKIERPPTPAPISEVGDSETPVVISGFISGRFLEEVGDSPSELVLPQTSCPIGPVHLNYGRTEESALESAEMLEDDVSDQGAAAPALSALRATPTPAEAERYQLVASQLNDIARQIESKYSGDIDQLVDSLNLVSAVAYDAFAAVARQIIRKGITWSRVVVLFLFGWRVMKKVHTLNVPGFLQSVLEYLLKFMTENVLKWITERGGWVDFLQNPPRPESDLVFQLTPLVLGGIAATGVAAVAVWYLFFRKP